MSVIYPGRNIVLVGMMGTGKSAVARVAAERLGRDVVDTDALIEAELGKTIPEVFATDGERVFRDTEAQMCRHVGSIRGVVVAVGGGAVVNPANVTSLRATGDLVWLDATPEVIAKRVGDGTDRPVLADAHDVAARVRELHGARYDVYRRAAALHVDTTNRSIDDIAGEILSWAQRQPGLLAREEKETLA